MILEKAREDI